MTFIHVKKWEESKLSLRVETKAQMVTQARKLTNLCLLQV